MKYQKIINLLDIKSDVMPKFNTKKLIKVEDQFGRPPSTNKEIRFETSMLRLDLCNYSDDYIVVKRTIIVTGEVENDRRNKSLVLKNNIPFISCTSKVNGILIDNAEDLDFVIPM